MTDSEQQHTQDVDDTLEPTEAPIERDVPERVDETTQVDDPDLRNASNSLSESDDPGELATENLEWGIDENPAYDAPDQPSAITREEELGGFTQDQRINAEVPDVDAAQDVAADVDREINEV